MDQSLRRKDNNQDDALNALQGQVAALEAELGKIEKELGAFEDEIHKRLDKQIARIRELYALYKRQKKEKKAKRLEQKKRGKNYKEPKQVKHYTQPKEDEVALNVEEQKELKRLYKEAIVQVHPDKFVHGGELDKIQRANAITAQLNGIYKRGDLEELINFYQYIISGHESPERSYTTEPVVDAKVRLEALQRKKEILIDQLEQLKNSYTYQVLTTYENPLSFIGELHVQFQERIAQLEKRTRTK